MASSVHLIGICGTAMASLAGLFQQLGWRVTGSDENVYPPMSTQLEGLGIQIQQGYRAENIPSTVDLIIIGNVIRATNPEAVAAVASGVRYLSLPQALGEFAIGSRESIVVAGTHGKTTSTSMAAWVATCCQFQPGFLIGGIARNFSRSFEMGRPPYFVIEGDEYDTAFFDKVPKFIHYRPKHVILTSVEFDHADIYPNLDAVVSAFKRLIGLIPPDGTLVYRARDPNIQRVLQETGGVEGSRHRRGFRAVSFGEGGDYEAQGVKFHPQGTEFQWSSGGEPKGPICTGMTGDYNVWNALGVLALSDMLGWPSSTVAHALASFEGVKRRQEILGEPQGVLVIEDFAHHPTAVKETVKAVRARYPGRRIFAVLEARSATSRRSVFQQDYVNALVGVDHVVLPPAFNQDGIPAEERFSVDKLVSDLRARGKDAYQQNDVDAIVEHLGGVVHSGDVILIMSNGGFGGIYQKLLGRLNALLA